MSAIEEHIRSYYRALNGEDEAAVAAHFTEDAVHYYTRLEPHVGGQAIAANTRWAWENIDGRWHLEHVLVDEAAQEAAIEWAMTWRDPRSDEPRINRGAEIFRFRDGLICEVRAYHHGDAKNPEGNLLGFDLEDRGYTRLDGEDRE